MLVENIKTDKTFSKQERLCSKKSIDSLFSKGNSFIAYPLRVVYTIEKASNPEDSGSAIMVSVSKKKFKRAVKRNRVKRLIREAYRHNKHLIVETVEDNNVVLHIAFLYLKDELPNYEDVNKAMTKSFGILSDKLSIIE